MQVLIKALEEQKPWILKKSFPTNIQIHWFNGTLEQADVYFDFSFSEKQAAFEAVSDKLVFVNDVLCRNTKDNLIRFNGWKSFWERPIVEIASFNPEWLSKATDFLSLWNWEYIITPNEAGFISARTIAMIVNEAYFALEEEVSSKDEIDTAMKLGTNYPFGPFEWSSIIGLSNIAALLQQLTLQDDRYTPSTLLLKEVNLV